ncbi:hypothetical protein EZY14_016420 [Kordia sp. TARA_039_SRF]|nr:hypothetical protein EZY14_016420 [Kordia sp. TARA_039_SRF]
MIEKILQVSQSQFENMMLIAWLDWCIVKSSSPEDLQTLLANQALNKWWRQEYTRLLNEFTDFIKPYAESCSQPDKMRLYTTSVVMPLQKLYSKKLIQNARKL